MKLIRLWVPVLTWMGIIFFLSSRERIQVSETEAVNFFVFKTLHMIEYALLYVLSFRAIKYTYINRKEIFWYTAAYVMTVCFSASDEIHQTFVPSRGGMARDVIIDAAGMVIAWILLWILFQKAPKKLRAWAAGLQIL